MQKRKPEHDKIRAKHQDPLVKAIADYYNRIWREELLPRATVMKHLYGGKKQ